jgi:hypothetical protein
MSLRDSFCLYSERGVNILDFKGDEFVWSRRELSSTIGLLTRNCIVEVKGVHFFLGDGDIYKNDGNTISSIAHDRIRKRLNESISADFYERSYAVNNVTAKEVWFCIPEGGSEYPNTAIVYNWRDDTWAIRDISGDVAYSAYGGQSDPPDTYATFGGGGGTYETTATYGAQKRTPLNETIVGADIIRGSLNVLDPTIVSLPSGVVSRLERTNLVIDGHLQVNTLVRAYPHIDGVDPVDFQFGSQMFSGGPVTWQDPVEFDPVVDRKIDIKTTGMLHAWRVTNKDKPVGGVEAIGDVGFNLALHALPVDQVSWANNSGDANTLTSGGSLFLTTANAVSIEPLINLISGDSYQIKLDMDMGFHGEMVEDVGFNDVNAWDIGAGDVWEVDGVAHPSQLYMDRAVGNAPAQVPIVADVVYELTIDIAENSENGIDFLMGGGVLHHFPSGTTGVQVIDVVQPNPTTTKFALSTLQVGGIAIVNSVSIIRKIEPLDIYFSGIYITSSDGSPTYEELVTISTATSDLIGLFNPSDSQQVVTSLSVTGVSYVSGLFGMTGMDIEYVPSGAR